MRRVINGAMMAVVITIIACWCGDRKCFRHVVMAASSSASAPSTTIDKDTKQTNAKRIGLLTASLPWTFGPYQNQMYQLSHLLPKQNENYDICWMTFGASTASLPPGEYHLTSNNYHSSSLHHHLPTIIPPPDEYLLDHITFLGQLDITNDNGNAAENNPSSKWGTASHLNAMAKQYNLDIILTLMDVSRIIPDEAFNQPVVAWIPLHSQQVVKSSSDYWTLRHFHGVAILAPSLTGVIDDAVGTLIDYNSNEDGDERIQGDIERSSSKREVSIGGEQQQLLETVTRITGKTVVKFIPHIIDRMAIRQSAQRGLELLRTMSVAHADSKLSNGAHPPILDRGQERTLQIGHPRSLFGSSSNNSGANRNTCNDNIAGTVIDDNTFIVLLQGGNYDEHEDRKGWDTSIQAFVLFYNRLLSQQQEKDRDDNNNNGEENDGTCLSSSGGGSKVHLLVHSMESYLIESDKNGDVDAPPMILPKGHQLFKVLHESGLPRHLYTLDPNKHQPEVVAAYKARASVCLHPSKVEGFGMNVLECQAVGTPVITTNYTAMGDYTKHGRSVPPRQMIKTAQDLYSMALPDVEGITNSLMDLYEEHTSSSASSEVEKLSANEKKLAEEWIDSTFSPAKVGQTFQSLLREAEQEFKQRSRARKELTEIPQSAGYVLARGYHSKLFLDHYMLFLIIIQLQI